MRLDVGGWLRNIGLGEHEAPFTENDIDLEIVRELTQADLASPGLSLGHRKRLLKAIRALEGPPTDGTLVDSVETTARGPERRYLTVMFCDLVGSSRPNRSNCAPLQVLRGSGGISAGKRTRATC